MQKLTDGVGQVEVGGTTLRQVIEELETNYPGMRARLVDEEDDRVRTDIAVAVNGEISREGLRRKVAEGSEIHFLPAISGG